MENQKPSSENIMIQSLSSEIAEKSTIIARLQANMYKLATENQKLKKQTKAKSGSKK